MILLRWYCIQFDTALIQLSWLFQGHALFAWQPAVTMALPFLVFWDKILHTVYSYTCLAHCQWSCNLVTNSPGAEILVTMCHMLYPQRLPSLARCSLCHWVQHLYKLRIFWALHRHTRRRLLAQLSMMHVTLPHPRQNCRDMMPQLAKFTHSSCNAHFVMCTLSCVPDDALGTHQTPLQCWTKDVTATHMWCPQQWGLLLTYKLLWQLLQGWRSSHNAYHNDIAWVTAPRNNVLQHTDHCATCIWVLGLGFRI